MPCRLRAPFLNGGDVILDQIKKRQGTELDEKYARLAEADILMLFALLLWETNESIKLYERSMNPIACRFPTHMTI